MWNEAGGLAGGSGEIGIDEVVHVGRSSFRMTAVAAGSKRAISKGFGGTTAPEVKMAPSLFDRAAALADADLEEMPAEKPRGTVTLPWWSAGLAGVALLGLGAGASAVWVGRHQTLAETRRTPAIAVAPAATVLAPPAVATPDPGPAAVPERTVPVPAVAAAPAQVVEAPAPEPVAAAVEPAPSVATVEPLKLPSSAARTASAVRAARAAATSNIRPATTASARRTMAPASRRTTRAAAAPVVHGKPAGAAGAASDDAWVDPFVQ